MAEHKIFHGDKLEAAKLLPYARQKLQALRRELELLGKTRIEREYPLPGNARIKIHIAGGQEFIHIWPEGVVRFVSRQELDDISEARMARFLWHVWRPRRIPSGNEAMGVTAVSRSTDCNVQPFTAIDAVWHPDTNTSRRELRPVFYLRGGGTPHSPVTIPAQALGGGLIAGNPSQGHMVQVPTFSPLGKTGEGFGFLVNALSPWLFDEGSQQYFSIGKPACFRSVDSGNTLEERALPAIPGFEGAEPRHNNGHWARVVGVHEGLQLGLIHAFDIDTEPESASDVYLLRSTDQGASWSLLDSLDLGSILPMGTDFENFWERVAQRGAAFRVTSRFIYMGGSQVYLSALLLTHENDSGGLEGNWISMVSTNDGASFSFVDIVPSVTNQNGRYQVEWDYFRAPVVVEEEGLLLIAEWRVTQDGIDILVSPDMGATWFFQGSVITEFEHDVGFPRVVLDRGRPVVTLPVYQDGECRILTPADDTYSDWEQLGRIYKGDRRHTMQQRYMDAFPDIGYMGASVDPLFPNAFPWQGE